MKKHFLIGFLALMVSVSIVGCGPASPPPATPRHTVCTPAELVAPALNSPAMWAVVESLTPTLSWGATELVSPYPYESCFPLGYDVDLRLGPLSTFDLGGINYGAAQRSWTPSTPLLPGSEYYWGVNALALAGGEGPYAGDRVFFTGPMCATEALSAPTLMLPRNGSLVSARNPLLVWNYVDPCLPQGYRIDLSTNSSFTDTSLSGGTGNPSTRWLPGTDLADCTWYYWRVAPINGTTLGPFSITKNFMVNTGSCLYPMPALDIPIEPLVTLPPAIVPFEPEFTLTRNANCRIGPSQVFEVYTSYFAGTVLPIVGRNEEATWVYASTPDKGHCWISIATGTFNGDLDALPVAVSPPLPPSYYSCQEYTTQALCKEDPMAFGCYWGQNNSCVPKP